MWKRAFIILLSLDLLLLVLGLAWFNSFPQSSVSQMNASSSENTLPDSPSKAASVQLSIGDAAINSYLEYALLEQSDLQKVFSSAQIHFSKNWECDMEIKLLDRVIPFQLELSPEVMNGNLNLTVLRSTMGGIPLPTDLFFLVLRHLPWPNWIHLNPEQHIIALEFTERPQHPYGLRVIEYSSVSKLLTLLVTIAPKNFLSPHSY